MDIKNHTIPVSKTARFSSFGNLTKNTKYFWFALHGSHMLCKQMLYKFRDFDPNEHFIIAPEGLSRFYLKGFSGDVVATWMTSEDRLLEIADFTEYLDTLYSQYLSQIPADCKKIILGFSQGGTTAFRWMHNKKVNVDHVVAYSSWIPEDIDFQEATTSLDTIPIIYTVGLQDQFLTDERINLQEQIIEKNQLKVDYAFYEGDHRVDRAQLMKLFHKFLK